MANYELIVFERSWHRWRVSDLSHFYPPGLKTQMCRIRSARVHMGHGETSDTDKFYLSVDVLFFLIVRWTVFPSFLSGYNGLLNSFSLITSLTSPWMALLAAVKSYPIHYEENKAATELGHQPITFSYNWMQNFPFKPRVTVKGLEGTFVLGGETTYREDLSAFPPLFFYKFQQTRKNDAAFFGLLDLATCSSAAWN